MQVSFESVRVTYFKSHDSLEMKFGQHAKISGRNGIGKSSIGEAVSWLMFGTDMMGSKIDPAPIHLVDPEAVTSVDLLAKVQREDGTEMLVKLGKQQKAGKVSYLLNDVPTKATQFDEAIAELFDKNYFLSSFNPIYFFTQHWKEQREQLLKYVSEPINKEVFDRMPDQVKAAALKEASLKHSIEDIQKINKPKYAEADRQHERAAERWLTLTEQLEQAQGQTESIDEAAIDEEKTMLQEQLQNAKKTNNAIQQESMERERKQHEMKNLYAQVLKIKDKVIHMQDAVIQENCKTCGQSLDAGAINIVKENRAAEIQEQKEKGRALMDEYKAKQAAFKELPELHAGIDASAVQSRLNELNNVLEAQERLKPLADQVEKAKQAKEDNRKEYLKAQELLEAIKSYDTVKSELMAEKVGGLFKNLSVKLENVAKNGAVSPCFEVEWSGKPYSKLSTAEKIKAGLELIAVLSEQSGKVLPVFIDNAESIITFSQPAGQLITSTVKNSHLIIKNEGEENNE